MTYGLCRLVLHVLLNSTGKIHRIEGVIDSGYFIAPALLFSTQVRMGEKTVSVSTTVNLIICNISFTVISYWQSVNLGGKRILPYGPLSVTPESCQSEIFFQERFIF